MFHFSPTPRGMSRTITEWLFHHGADRFVSVDKLLGAAEKDASLKYIMGRHHPAHLKPDAKSFGIVRNPYNRIWSAYLRFRSSEDESFDSFWQRWQACAPTDQAMLEPCDLILKFEDGRDRVWEAMRQFTGINGPTKIIDDRHKQTQPKQNLTDSQKAKVQEFYQWTFDNFDYKQS